MFFHQKCENMWYHKNNNSRRKVIMKIKKILFISVCAVLCAVFLTAGCGVGANTGLFAKLISKLNAETLPLYNEDGTWSEENFVYNMALPKEKGLTLFENSSTKYIVIIPEEATELEKTAVKDFQTAFKEISGAEIVVKTDAEPQSAYEIVIGKTNRSFIPCASFKLDAAYCIANDGTSLYLYAQSEYGTSNAVYGFLEEYLGVMFLTSTETYYPPLKTAIVSPMCDVQEPAFEVRDEIAIDTDNNDLYRRKLRMTCDEVYTTDGCHHSLNIFSQEFLDAHPEYCAEIGGARRTSKYMFQDSQLCFSNPDVIDLLEEYIVAKEEANTDERVHWWDVSQMDSMNYCTCEKCTALYEKYNSKIGAILDCMITVANRHPDIHMSTLAYHYGSTPPVNVDIPDNLMIKWCIMSEFGANDYSTPLNLSTSDIGKQQYSEICGWGKLTDNIYVWDYITNFFCYQLPFPCLQTIAGNMQVLRDNNVNGVFSLNAYTQRAAGDYIKSYLTSHATWNPDLDWKALVNKYFTVYFGAGASYIIKLYDTYEEEVKAPLYVYDLPVAHKTDFLSLDNVNKYWGYLNSAFDAVKSSNDEAAFRHLEYEKISLLYTSISLKYGTSDELTAYKAELKSLCNSFGITVFNELGTVTVANFCK